MLNTAIQAAREAGKIQLRAFRDRSRLVINQKTAGDFVTEVDKMCEEKIIEVLSNAYPSHNFLGEESGLKESGKSEYTWIIDPLDGTTNFIHGIAQFAVSIALCKNNQLIHAVVYDAPRNELFTASKGKGAVLDNRRIRVSGLTDMKKALVGTGFPFREEDNYSAYMKTFEEVAENTSGIRRPGSAALDLCWLACGRYDAFWEKGIRAWDIAAGALIALESGALVTDFAGEGAFLDKGEIVAATPKLFASLLGIIQKHNKK